MSDNRNQEYEKNLPVIDEQLNKRSDQWKLTSLSWMDYDDVKQIIRIHILNKWDQYDPSKPLAPWVNKIITHQIKNIIRNNFSNFASPCSKCPASLPDGGCEVYETQCEKCPIFNHWSKRKKDAYNIKVPLSLEFHGHETETFQSSDNLPAMVENLHKKMKLELSPYQWKVYQALYIDGKNEMEVADELGYKTNEKNRSPGYKQIKNIQKIILLKAKKCIYSGKADII